MSKKINVIWKKLSTIWCYISVIIRVNWCASNIPSNLWFRNVCDGTSAFRNKLFWQIKNVLVCNILYTVTYCCLEILIRHLQSLKRNVDKLHTTAVTFSSFCSSCLLNSCKSGSEKAEKSLKWSVKCSN